MSKKSRREVVIHPKKFATYALAGAAAVLSGETVDGDLTIVGVADRVEATGPGVSNQDVATIYFPGTATSYQLEFVHSLNSTSSSLGVGRAGGNVVTVAPGVSVAGSGSYVSNVAKGQNISALVNWIAATTYGTLGYTSGVLGSQFQDQGYAQIAVRWDGDGAGPDGFSYGWVQLDMDGNTSGTGIDDINAFDVIGYVYGDPGESFNVGAVPEPGSLGCLALGAVGLISWRRRRNEHQVKSIKA